MPENDGPEIGVGSVTEVTSQSWISRLLGSLGGVLFGLALIPASAIGLWWNEGRAVQTAQSLAEGAGSVVAVGPQRLDPANEGRLVYVTGQPQISAPVRDADFGVGIDTLRLRRKVEMYQWKEETQTETRNKLGGGQETITTYKYIRVWSEQPIDSARFREPGGHANPRMPWQSRDFVPPAATLGPFALPASLLGQLDADDALALDAASVERIGRNLARPAHRIEAGVHVGRDPAAPQIGDLRVSFTHAGLAPVSVIAAQSGGALQPWQTRAGDSLHMIAAGTVPAAEMFRAAEQANTVMTWILRGVGALAMFIGFSLLLRPLSVLASVLPFLGDIVGAGAGLIGLTLTAMLAPLVIALAWLFYRPLIGIAILLLGAALTFALARLARRRAAARARPAMAATAGPVMR